MPNIVLIRISKTREVYLSYKGMAPLEPGVYPVADFDLSEPPEPSKIFGSPSESSRREELVEPPADGAPAAPPPVDPSRAFVAPLADLREYGKTLFTVLLEPLAVLLKHLSLLKGSRLWLDLEKVPDLARLPWELLYYANGKAFAGANDQRSVSRIVRDGDEPSPLLRHDDQIRVLNVCSTAGPGYDPDPEIKSLTSASGSWFRRWLFSILEWTTRFGVKPAWLLKVRVEHVPHPDWSVVAERIRDFQPHIVHFMGHGGFARDFALKLHSPAVEGVPANPASSRSITASSFANTFGELRPILVVLCACESGSLSPDSTHSVASVLAERGVRFVVGMQASIQTRTAQDFTEAFYKSLFDKGDVDIAATAGRARILGAEEENKTSEFAAPVFYRRINAREPFKEREASIFVPTPPAATTVQEKPADQLVRPPFASRHPIVTISLVIAGLAAFVASLVQICGDECPYIPWFKKEHIEQSSTAKPVAKASEGYAELLKGVAEAIDEGDLAKAERRLKEDEASQARRNDLEAEARTRHLSQIFHLQAAAGNIADQRYVEARTSLKEAPDRITGRADVVDAAVLRARERMTSLIPRLETAYGEVMQGQFKAAENYYRDVAREGLPKGWDQALGVTAMAEYASALAAVLVRPRPPEPSETIGLGGDALNPISAAWVVGFDTHVRMIDAPSLARLKVVAARLNSTGLGGLKIEIIGKADRRGSQAFNLALSKARAEAVARALRDGGVPGDSLDVVVGIGERWSEGHDPVGWAKDREVEIRLRIPGAQSIEFAPAAADLPPGAAGALDAIAAWLRTHDGRTIVVEGRSTPDGTRARNLALSEDRAEAVRRALAQRGIDERVRPFAYGEVRPMQIVRDDADPDRRVWISVQ